MSRKHRVLIVDDSEAMCKFLEMVLGQDPDLEVVGHALDPYEARELIKRRAPDVLTLDVEMPRMDGITFLRNLMRLRPMPVVMLSSLTTAGAEVTLDALQLGAVDFAVKRQPTCPSEMSAYAQDIRDRVRQAANSAARRTKVDAASSHSHHDDLVRRAALAPRASADVHRVIGIGASTGGPVAVMDILPTLALKHSCAVVCQHMPPHFMPAYARRLDQNSRARVVMAENGISLEPGTVYVAPGNEHLLVQRTSGTLHCATSTAPKVNDFRPSVDVMFASLADAVGASSIGVLLTGMGQDGAAGMCRIRESGGVTVAQDRATSVVWGMPGSAVRAGGVDIVQPVEHIAGLLNRLGCADNLRAGFPGQAKHEARLA